MSEAAQDVVDEFISHPNTRTLHRGTRDDGAACGQPGDTWVGVGADNPLEAVVAYGVRPCSKCFKRSYRLAIVYKKVHSATLITRDMAELTATLPWSPPRGEAEDGGGDE